MVNPTVSSTSDAPRTPWESRTDEEIAEHLDRRNLKYRRGWPRLLPFPLQTIRTEADPGEDEAFQKEVHDFVRAICHAQEIEVTDIFLARRMPRVDNQEESIFTLVIKANLRDEPALDQTVISIRKYLQERTRTEDFAIEIIDDRILDDLYTFNTIPSDGGILQQYNPIFEIAKEEIMREDEIYKILSIKRRGLYNDEALCHPTLLIMSPTAARHVWADSIIPNIERGLASREIDLKVEVWRSSSPVSGGNTIVRYIVMMMNLI